MILTCPECATSYFVDDSRIPSDGRRVKCSSCGHRWRAGPDGPIVEPEPLVLAERLRVHVEQPRGHADKVEIVFDCHAFLSF